MGASPQATAGLFPCKSVFFFMGLITRNMQEKESWFDWFYGEILLPLFAVTFFNPIGLGVLICISIVLLVYFN